MTPGLGIVAFAGKVFFWAGVITLCVGVCILVSPALVARAGRAVNRWIPTDALFRRLDSSTLTERGFYRHHRLSGILLMLGAGFVIYQFALGINYSALFGKAMFMGSHAAAAWLVRALGFITMVFSALAFGLGVVVFFRPSLLKHLEQRANTWFAADDSLKRLDEQVAAPDRLFGRNPRLVGLLVVLGSLYVIFSLRLFL